MLGPRWRIWGGDEAVEFEGECRWMKVVGSLWNVHKRLSERAKRHLHHERRSSSDFTFEGLDC